MTTVVEERTQSRVSELLDVLRAAGADGRRCYARMPDVISQLEAERPGAAAGSGTTARLLAGVLDLSKSESRTRAEHAEWLASRQSLTGEVLPPPLPATAAELAAGTVGPAQVRVITATMLGSYITASWPAGGMVRPGWCVGVGGAAGGDLLSDF